MKIINYIVDSIPDTCEACGILSSVIYIIPTENGGVKMPTAEYNKDGSYTREQVLDSAKKAAAQTKKEFCVLVTESNGRTWYNLDPA